jgi:hypothetical protein
MQQDHAEGLTRPNFIGGSDARIIMGQDEKALSHLWQEKRGEVGPENLSGPRDREPQSPVVRTQHRERHHRTHLRQLSGAAYADGFFNRTPSPPPFFSMNSMPASSSARRITRSLAAVNEVAAPVSSARRIVVSPTDDERARSSALQRRSARAARI